MYICSDFLLYDPDFMKVCIKCAMRMYTNHHPNIINIKAVKSLYIIASSSFFHGHPFVIMLPIKVKS